MPLIRLAPRRAPRESAQGAKVAQNAEGSERLRGLRALGVLRDMARSATQLTITREPESQPPRAGSGPATQSIRMVPTTRSVAGPSADKEATMMKHTQRKPSRAPQRAAESD